MKNYGIEALPAIECFDDEGDLLGDEFVLAYHLWKILFGGATEEKK